MRCCSITSTKISSIIILLISLALSGCASNKPREEISIDDSAEVLPPDPERTEYTEAPKPLNSVKPVYPYHAEKDGITGVVWVQALIDSTGKVAEVRIAKDSGKNVGFEEAAMEATRKCKWEPAKNNGKPVSTWVTYKIEFELK